MSSVLGACSPEAEPGSSFAASEGNFTAAGAEGRAIDRGISSSVSELHILISSDRGVVTADLTDNSTTRALVRMLPITIEMRDHLRQEKTGNLPSALPDMQRQLEFSAGTLGLWGNEDFVIYYRSGRVPQPGIIFLGHVTGDLSIFDRPEPVTVRIRQAD